MNYLITVIYPFKCMCSMKQNGYRITKTATITPVIKRTQVPTATPTVARQTFPDGVKIAS